MLAAKIGGGHCSIFLVTKVSLGSLIHPTGGSFWPLQAHRDIHFLLPACP